MPAGRPTDYDKEYNDQVIKLCRLGATDKEIADFFNIAESTLNLWKQAHPEFMESIRKGKIESDANVADSLYKRAIGYSHKAVKIFADVKSGEEKIVEYIEHYPPDTKAATYWLNNRRKDWADKMQQEHSGNVVITSTPLDEEL